MDIPPMIWDLLNKLGLSDILLVHISLILQLVLVLIGSWRKYTSNNIFRLILLFIYSSSSWVVTFSYGLLVEKYGGGCYEESSDPTYAIRTFWVAFLLLYIVGSDTITAYSMADNDVWLRALFGLISQIVMLFYIFSLALKSEYQKLNYLSFPVFFSGIIKYVEKIWALRSASPQHLRDLLVSAPPLRPNEDQDFEFPIKITTQEETPSNHILEPDQLPYISDTRLLHIAYCFFKRDKRFFVDFTPTSFDLKQSLHYFENFNYESAFKVIELELGFMFDFFYTKASIIHSQRGSLLRLASCSSLIIAFTTFCMRDKKVYPESYVFVTFFHFFGVLGIEIYSLILFLRSDWIVISFTRASYSLCHLMFKAISGCGWSVRKRSRWSNSIRQYNLISRCLEQKNDRYFKFLRTCYIKIMPASKHVSDELKRRIFEQLTNDQDNKKLPVAGRILRKHNCYEQLGWSLKFDSDQTILLWHIATDICYHFDNKIEEASENSILEDSVLLSDFLTHLLVYNPSLFPNGMSEIRFSATNDDVVAFLKRKNSIKLHSDACKSMLDDDEEGDESCNNNKSMLFDGCRLARQLQELEQSKRWEIMSHVWVAMLANISCEFEWYEHGKQLRLGGNLLTHVWILMHHLGYIKPANQITMQDDEQEDTLLDEDEIQNIVVDHMVHAISTGGVDSIFDPSL